MFTGVCPCQSSKDSWGKLGVKALAEFLGTYFLIQAIIFSVNSGSVLAPLAIGSTLMVCIYAWGHVSGAHYNPAVSTACYVAGKIDRTTYLIYLVAQFIAGILSGYIAYSLILNTGAEYPRPEILINVDAAYYTEFIWTFLLASVVLNVATTCAEGYKDNSFFGLAIGFTVVSGAISVGSFSGGSFNPAVTTGLNIGIAQLDDQDFAGEDWYQAVIFEFLGGIVAGLIFRITEWSEMKTPLEKGVEVMANEVDGGL